jgi:UDP-glucose 4-epimerase
MTSPRWDDWYPGRRVLVLGGLGFIGQALSRRLVRLRAACTIVTPDRKAHAAEAAAFEVDGARVIEGDLRDAELMRSTVKDHAVVFNLSGRSGAVQSMVDPLTDLDVNCRGNLVLLDALRATAPDAKIIFPGSRLEYGRPTSLPVAENHSLDPLCIHGAHKIAVESYLKIYGELYGLRSTILRITNPFGPGQPANRDAYGVVDALVAAGASAETDGRVYNIGSGVGTQFVEMARTIVDLAGGGRLAFRPWPELARQIETGDFIADITRMQADTGWQPATTLTDGLRRTIDAYRMPARV